MISKLAVFVSFVGYAHGDAANWYSKSDYGSQDGLMVCKGDKWMNGVCATSAYRYCKHWGSTKSNMVRCERFDGMEKETEGKFVVGKWSLPVQCDIEQGYAAISACSSGMYDDCQTLHSSDWHPHHLQCAKGLRLITTDTKEVHGNNAGDRIQCPAGYVVYKFCASRVNYRCKDQDGRHKSHVIGCVKVATGDADEDKDDDRLITKVTGFWKPQLIYNKRATKGYSEGVETSEGTVMKTVESKKYGTSQDVTVGISTGSDFTVQSKMDVSIGFSQEYQRTVWNEVHTTLTKSEFESEDLECGNDDENMQETVWQWYWKTETKNGNPGPAIKTKNFHCAPGNQYSFMTRPRCAPGHCLDGAMCTVCSYDYCDVKLVQNTTTGTDTFQFSEEEVNGAKLSTIDTFHFDRTCVDRKLDRKDWGEKRTDEVGAEYHRAEHVRDGKVMQVGFVFLRREAWNVKYGVGFGIEDSSDIPEMEVFPDAAGTWVPEHKVVSEWQEGDQFRILAEWETPLSAASPISVALAVSIALLSILAW